MNYIYITPFCNPVYMDQPLATTLAQGNKSYVLAGAWKRVEVPGEPRPFAVGQVVKTRGGRSARIICTDRKSDRQPIIALVESRSEEGRESVQLYFADGKFNSPGSSEWDLIPNTGPAQTELRWVPNPDLPKLIEALKP